MFEYLNAGRCHGPITAEELLELVESGELGPEDLVRRTNELAFHSVRDMLNLLQTSRMLEQSRPPPRLSSTGKPSTPGGYTVFSTAPPIPPNPVPRLDALHCDTCGVALSSPGKTCASCAKRRRVGIRCDRCGRNYPADARFCGACGHSLV